MEGRALGHRPGHADDDRQRPGDTGVFVLRQSASAMGSTFSITLHGHARNLLEEAAGAAFDELRRLDRLLSIYRPDSEWSLINRDAARRPVPVSPESFRLLVACLENSRRTEGAFDITVGPLKKAWGFHRGTGTVPPAEVLAAARTRVGYALVQLDAATGTVRFDRPGVEVDPGGVGKGYAVDRMVDILRRHGIDTALISGASSSIAGLGTPGSPGTDGWRADIRDPGSSTSVISVTLKDTSLSTSGTCERNCWSDGQMYSDIVDPRTGWPLQALEQVSVVTPNAFDGEVWAKACLLNGPRWASEHTPADSRVVCWHRQGEGGSRAAGPPQALAAQGPPPAGSSPPR